MILPPSARSNEVDQLYNAPSSPRLLSHPRKVEADFEAEREDLSLALEIRTPTNAFEAKLFEELARQTIDKPIDDDEMSAEFLGEDLFTFKGLLENEDVQTIAESSEQGMTHKDPKD